MTTTELIFTLLAAASLATACALLSVIVVLRRWAFIGEGIGHSGFGGAGTAWLLMLFVPALDQPWLPSITVVFFCLATSIAIGAMSRRRGVNADAAIGIFLVASLAWGFLAQRIYIQHRSGVAPPLFDTLLFGQIVSLSPQYTLAAVGTCLGVVLLVAALWKEILAYAFDPLLAETSGVRSGLIHYLLMLAVALVIVIGMRLAGSVLVTALLVLPGATALLLTQRLQSVLGISLVVALTGCLGGLLLAQRSHYIPAGPAIVLLMFVEFLIAYAISSTKQAVPV